MKVMFFLRRRTWIIKAVLLLTALWFMVALLSHGGSRNLDVPSIEYVDAEAKPLKGDNEVVHRNPNFKQTSKRKESSYDNNLSDGNYYIFQILRA